MGMCAMYSFAGKYGPRPMHELDDGEVDDYEYENSSDGSSMLGDKRSNEQQPALWKRTIPKGRRCEPLDFSGLILYDEHGNRLNQFTPTSTSA